MVKAVRGSAMKWMMLICLAMSSAAYGQTTYYYCSTPSSYRATIYFTDVFSVPPGTDVKKIRNGFMSFVTMRFGESITGKARCTSYGDLIHAGVTRDKEVVMYQNLRWRAVPTHWQYGGQ